ncbi:hypothetical protein B0I33_111183 [Prauserella shujinwangii]|uniref:Uncharacterized protein n=1 Tax=Prauserella shujinwangii TaxID=1453103 RepID=A0A2T0LNB7_9PSEU|nr:hypothetical protein [Prauserella shujinwangii]PRX44670.1 hypothetical protein B0I33_111183 [Prauserella shujinwangii]
MSLDALRQLLTAVHSGVADARAHTDRAKSLLEESRRALVDSQAQAQPWLPPQLAQALDQIDGHHGRLTGIGDLLERYQSRL